MSMSYEICQAWPSETAMNPSDVFHLRSPESDDVTRCGLPIANATMVPLAAWGLPDSSWCADCHAGSGLPEITGRSRRKFQRRFVKEEPAKIDDWLSTVTFGPNTPEG